MESSDSNNANDISRRSLSLPAAGGGGGGGGESAVSWLSSPLTSQAIKTCEPLLRRHPSSQSQLQPREDANLQNALVLANILHEDVQAQDDVCAAAIYAETIALGYEKHLAADGLCTTDHVWRMAKRIHEVREILGDPAVVRDDALAKEARRKALRNAGTRAVAVDCARTLLAMRLAANNTPGAAAGPGKQELALRAAQLHAPLARSLRLGVVPLVSSRDRASVNNRGTAATIAGSTAAGVGVELESLALAALVPRAWHRALRQLALQGETYDELLDSLARTLASAIERAPWVDEAKFLTRMAHEEACVEPLALRADNECISVYRNGGDGSGSGSGSSSSVSSRIPLAEVHTAFEDLPWPLAARLEVFHRRKTLTSAVRKMLRTGVEAPSNLRDLLGIRVVVHPPNKCKTVDDDDIWREARACAACYAVKAIMDALQEFGEVVPLRTKDYIASPKLENGYQSLHATYRITTTGDEKHDQEVVFLEVQIRTAGMHREAEYGAARHEWYKGGVVRVSDWHAAALASLPSSDSMDDGGGGIPSANEEAMFASLPSSDVSLRRSFRSDEPSDMTAEQAHLADREAARVAAALRGAVRNANRVTG
ncbi:RelA/SpoT domain-containing protein [Pseudoscourfieldia marina]